MKQILCKCQEVLGALFVLFILKTSACYNGGTPTFNSCQCIDGYTGDSCEVFLYDGNHFIERFTEKLNYLKRRFDAHSFNSPSSLNQLRKSILRFRRQASSTEGSGSGSDASSSTTSRTTSTSTSSASCVEGQILSNEGGCIYPRAFRLRFTVNETFQSEYSNLQSPTTQSFVRRITEDIEGEMANTGFESIVVTNLLDGSVIFETDLSFEEDSSLSTIEANLLLQTRLDQFSRVAVGDKNECDIEEICGANTTCTNADGTFSCSCAAGFIEVTSSTLTRRKLCESSCKDVVCLNGGVCIIGANNESVCRCSELYSGSRCENSGLPWRQATIAIGVILVVTLLVIMGYLAYVFFRMKDVKQEELPLHVPRGTRFNSAAKLNLEGHSNPYEVNDREVYREYTSTKVDSENEKSTIATTTFGEDTVRL